MRRREYVPGRVVEQSAVKIPSGYNCLSCKAKGCLRYQGSTAVKSHICLLYGMELRTHSRRI